MALLSLSKAALRRPVRLTGITTQLPVIPRRHLNRVVTRAPQSGFDYNLNLSGHPSQVQNVVFRAGVSTQAQPQPMNVTDHFISNQDEFWRKTKIWADVPAKDFLSYRWSVSVNPYACLTMHNRTSCLKLTLTFFYLQVANTVQGGPKLRKFLTAVLPDHVPLDRSGSVMQTRDELINDVFEGVTAATMAIRITYVWRLPIQAGQTNTCLSCLNKK